MNCQRMRDEIKAYIDGELGWISRRRVTRHLSKCTECRAELQRINELTDEIREIEPVPVPSGLRERIMAEIASISSQAGSRRVISLRPVVAASLLIVFIGIGMATRTVVRNNRARVQSSHQIATKDTELSAHLAAAPTTINSTEALPKSKHATGEPAWSSPNVGVDTGSDAMDVIVSQPTIIKTADLSMEVKRFQVAYDRVVTISKSAGGYVSDSSTEADEAVPTSGTVTLRVPVVTFERTIERLGKLGVVKSKAIHGQDVTGQVVDLESALRNKRAEEKQYLDVMSRAKRVPDIVTVSQELYRVRGEIEEAQGQLKYLKTSAAMSTINLELRENEKAKPAPKSQLRRTFGDAVGSLGRTLGGLAAVLVWLAVYSPFWLLAGGVGLYFRRRLVSDQSADQGTASLR
jgi:hypothetical protein